MQMITVCSAPNECKEDWVLSISEKLDFGEEVLDKCK